MTDTALPPVSATPSAPSPPAPSALADDRQIALIVYILLLVPFAFPVTHLIGLVLAYVNRAESRDWLHSHYNFQIRTFWIGCLYGFVCVISIIGILLLPVVAVWYIVRCALGLDKLMKRQPYPTPDSWTF